LALGEEYGTAEINLSSGNRTHSIKSFKKSKYSGPGKELLEVEQVEMVSFDDFMKQNTIDHVDILKIDAEGYEREVLCGGNKRSKAGVISVIIIEFMFVKIYNKQTLYFAFSSILHNCGYTIFDIPFLKRHKDGQIRCGDAVFISADLQRQKLKRI
jgi:hypothetical protein